MEKGFVCLQCGNQDFLKTGLLNGERYCRLCIAFKGEQAVRIVNEPIDQTIVIEYTLTSEQEKIAKEVTTNFLSGKNTLIYAVCGAGKTELVYDVINEALKLGKQVGFTVPRREVVIEIYQRIVNVFPFAQVQKVYGGHTTRLTGNIIVLTTHQLFRYKDYFDLLIFDEIDAFPYQGDVVLTSFFRQSVRGVYVLLSATPSKELLNNFSKNGVVLTLFTRFHNHKIPVPVVKRGFLIFNFLLLTHHLARFLRKKKPVLIFVPTIKQANLIYKLLAIEFKCGNVVHSKKSDLSAIISGFKSTLYNYLVTTTVLERGVTIKGLQVIIYGADHVLYDTPTLIQIAGRVGRKKEESDGEVIFIVTKSNQQIENAIKDINEKNEYLLGMLKKQNE